VRTEIISLPPLAAYVLTELRTNASNNDPRVFPPQHGAKIEINRDWAKVKHRAELPADLVLHSLRHSVGTVAAIGGMTGPEIQALLRHRSLTTISKYIHFADRVRLQDRAMANVVADVTAAKTAG
jgi:integrase